MKSAQILSFSDISRNKIKEFGNKAITLAEISNNGVLVPNGFVISAFVYKNFIESTSLRQKILSELSGLDLSDSKKILEASNKIQTAILSASLPEAFIKDLRNEYHKLIGEFHKEVIVRTSEALDGSFAGNGVIFDSIHSFDDLTEAVRKSYASLFDSKAIFYRFDKGFSHLNISTALIVQIKVFSEASGILFTSNPLSSDQNDLLIEAIFGSEYPLISHELMPDSYIVNKVTKEILAKEISSQAWQLVNKSKIPISKKYINAQKISDKQILKLSEIGIKIEKLYSFPYDVDWILEKGDFYIFDLKPKISNDLSSDLVKEEIKEIDETFLIAGRGLSPYVTSGKVHIIKDIKELKKAKKGEILVCKNVDSELAEVLGKFSGLIIEESGSYSNVAASAREFKIPCISGAGLATRLLKDGEVVTVDGVNGKILEGIVHSNSIQDEVPLELLSQKTATKILTSVSGFEIENKLIDSFDGVGLLNSNYLFSKLNEHPKNILKEKRQKEFIHFFSNEITPILKVFEGSPVIYRSNDLTTFEMSSLKGGKVYEDKEFDPFLGLRGASRYISDSEAFMLELEVIKHLRNKLDHKNLHIMIPFVRCVEELREVKKLISASGLRRSGSFKIWLKLDIPSNALLIEDLIEEGVDGVMIGADVLTSLVLGVDKTSPKIAHIFNELDLALLNLYEKVVHTCKKHKIQCSFFAGNQVFIPELFEKLVGWGVSSICIDPQFFEKTKKLVYEQERHLVSKHSKSSKS